MDSTSPKPTFHYGPVSAFLLTIAVFFGGQIGAVVLVSIFGVIANGLGLDTTLKWVNANELFSQTVLIGFAAVLSLVFIRWLLHRRGNTFRSIGFGDVKLAAVWQALLGFLVYVVCYLFAIGTLKLLVPALDLEQKQDLGIEISRQANIYLLFFNLLVVPPFLEEIMMRGFLFTGLRTKLSFVWATFFTSVLFAAAHLPEGVGGLLWVGAIDTFILSVVLCYLREKTGSLWPAIGLHMIKNAIALYYLVNIG